MPTSATCKPSATIRMTAAMRLHDQHRDCRAACACGSARDRIRRAPVARWPASSCRSRTSAASRPATHVSEADDEHRHRHRRHPHEELDELPAGVLRDQQVLRLAHLRHDAAERRADCRVHHQSAQERAKCIEIGAVQLVHLLVVTDVVFGVVVLAGSEAMEHLVEAGAHRDQRPRPRSAHRGRRTAPRTSGRRSAASASCERDAEQDLREREQQQLAQEVDARDHEDEQQDDRHGGERFVVDRGRRRQADQHAPRSPAGRRAATDSNCSAIASVKMNSSSSSQPAMTGPCTPPNNITRGLTTRKPTIVSLYQSGAWPRKLRGESAGASGC